MKKFFVTMIALLSALSAYSQKPQLQLNDYKSWPEVNGGKISDDGEFIVYNIANYPVSKNTVVVKQIKGNWQQTILNLTSLAFSYDSQFLLGKLPNDTLLIFNLYSETTKKINNIIEYKLIKNNLTTTLLYQKQNGSLYLCTINGKIKSQYANVINKEVSEDGSILLIQQRISKNEESIILVNLTTGSKQQIYQGIPLLYPIFDKSGNQIAFMVKSNNDMSLWHYKFGYSKALEIANNHSLGIDSGLTIEKSQFWQFSNDGKRLFFSLKQIQKEVQSNEDQDLELWSYQDAFFKRSPQLKIRGLTTNSFEGYLSVIALADRKVKQLVSGQQKIVLGSFRPQTDDVCLVLSSYGRSDEEWNESAHSKYFICNTHTGELRALKLNEQQRLTVLQISPTGKHVIYFNPKTEQYINYDISTSKEYPLNRLNEVSSEFSKHYYWPGQTSLGIIGWINNEQNVIIQGTYDLWSADLSDQSDPVNLTQGIGQKQNTVFTLFGAARGSSLGRDGRILLSAFDLNTKEFGFYTLLLRDKIKLVKLSMSSNYIGNIENPYSQLDDGSFQKAKDKDFFLFRFESANCSPNYFYSSDLQHFQPVSNVQPQEKSNWLTSELHTYSDSLGIVYRGVLYKPENFNPNIKYPVIFYIYEERGNLLNSFPRAEPSPGSCSISHLVSNGYLVFLPDIKKDHKGFPGNDALRSVIAAADHLKNFSWVNQQKLGITGGSTGGWETNFIVTHTNRFKAAISCSGMSDMIRFATDLREGEPIVNGLKYSRNAMGATFPESLDAYIRNSPIFFSKNINTPLLLLHNDLDNAVNYSQSLAFFLVLRNLQKKVWWLNYKGEGHGLGTKETNLIDYHTKAVEFWNYYLKDKPMPLWMKEHN